MKLFVKLIEPFTFIVVDIELIIKKCKKNITIELLNKNKITMYYIPVYTKIGIKLEKIIFPIVGKINNNKCLFYFNYIYTNTNIQNNINLYPEYFYSQIYQNLNLNLDLNLDYYHQDLITDLKILYTNEIILEDFLLKIFQVSLKFKNIMFRHLETNEVIPKSLIDIYQTKLNIMYGGQYFDNLEKLQNSRSNTTEFKYLNGVKHPEGTTSIFMEKSKSNLINFYYNFDFEDLISKYLYNITKLEFNKLNNLTQIYNNFNRYNLSNFQLILFILSNNLTIKSNNSYYSTILNLSKDILNTTNFITIEDVNKNDIINLKVFLNKYPKFKELFFRKSIEKINFTLDYSKKNIDSNLFLLLTIFENDTFLENQNLFVNFKPKLKQQFEILFFKKLNNSNEKYYRDYTIRLFTKKYLLLSSIDKEEFNLYNLFRNYFYNSKWNNIVTNFYLLNFIEKYNNILLFHGKINNVILPNNHFKDLINVIKNKFRVIEFIDSYISIYNFVLFNQTDLELILENYYSLSNLQLKNISKIIYLSKFINNNNYNSENYKNFISLCFHNSNLILTNNNFNLKIKEYLPKTELNYGKIVRDIRNYNAPNTNTLTHFEENIILKNLYLKYRKKYSKYKAKYFLEKYKNNKNFHIKPLKILKKTD
ncbi:hypothetical protein crov057 [Cafeteria roenbergensis virus]|uniref:Uncharacterized protein n=1 Tax=Cafeteria roenbergensis virus (strain BV-PW1) TaxID=693272 RepID=E3T4H7_CROVB|nr:hypothetical protein crov057 [Cafeteria roenbergensis virus BV-PW1]ADO67090.1 hypothetical protein crov057 [Cafeteria roenbergensis virus BV-PW1]